jgi:photosystem II stability/assembly factor-like uncharacterized protein
VKWLVALLLAATANAQVQAWLSQNSGTTASLRGVSAVSEKIVWASGAGGTWLRTMDGGVTWKPSVIPEARGLDFRGIRAFDENTAFLMSSGPGDKSRVLETTDGGAHWNLLFTNPDPKGFFDSIAFWDRKHGILLGDAVDGQMTVFTTEDTGQHWKRRKTPSALPNEGAFAASNSCLTLRGAKEAWFGTGGNGASRIFHSTNGGRSWTATASGIRSDSTSAGVFSLALSDGRNGIAVGGDYAKDQETRQNSAVTSDGGKTWKPGASPSGFRSAVVFLSDSNTWLVTGTSGTDISTDGGNSWKLIDTGPFNAINAVSSRAAWAVGPRGRIAIYHGN